MAEGWGGSLEGLEKNLCLKPTPSSLVSKFHQFFTVRHHPQTT
ncbi:uncharacterized protein METZ01_LOCUS291845 [marine metagenome]|uniref:Uncharacterized protein n=1 Tax=marine metagenome TaxID=408172 RepID=A0A382LVP8_9ZZZZ